MIINGGNFVYLVSEGFVQNMGLKKVRLIYHIQFRDSVERIKLQFKADVS